MFIKGEYICVMFVHPTNDSFLDPLNIDNFKEQQVVMMWLCLLLSVIASTITYQLGVFIF